MVTSARFTIGFIRLALTLGAGPRPADGSDMLQHDGHSVA
jgi:hypothetical protein